MALGSLKAPTGHVQLDVRRWGWHPCPKEAGVRRATNGSRALLRRAEYRAPRRDQTQDRSAWILRCYALPRDNSGRCEPPGAGDSFERMLAPLREIDLGSGYEVG